MRAGSFLFLSFFISLALAAQTVTIIPQPASLKMGNGSFTISKNTVIVAGDEADRKTARLFNQYLQDYYGFRLDIDKQEGKNFIRLNTRKFIKAPDQDAYVLSVTPEGVHIEGDTYAGTFYGIQTLIQLLPLPSGKNAVTQLAIPLVTVQDAPRFAYRGMHLDVARHFFPVDFIKKYIDYLALHKFNNFHWHLTDDQGWRIEIKKHPALTGLGAWRNGTIIGRYPGTGNDNQRYGGYYTQDQVREIVRYAAERHITVIPEIEMPGHASAAIAAYPWLSCFPEEPTVIPSHPSPAGLHQQAQGRKKLVQETWGVFEDVFCAGSDSTFRLLEEVMDEVLELFPSPYIHVGGDECPKNNWKRCPKCQARIRTEGLKDEHELQSYFIQRMEKYLNGKGRILIGWDEILEGGLAPNAVVMSWRGEKGGIEAAKQDHYVIMTPAEYVYFDYSQTRNEDSIVIGGYLPIEKVYGYDPVPKELAADKTKYILGAQANLWTEYIRYPTKAEYHIFPRMSALSEVLWSPKEKRNWADFEKRLQTQFKRYEFWGANYSRAYFDIRASISAATKNQGLAIKAEVKNAAGELFYQSKHNNDPKKFPGTLLVNRTDNLVIEYRNQGQAISRVKLDLNFNKATGKKVSIKTKPNEKYPGQGGAFSLVNGVYSHKGLSYPDWLGWIGDDMEALIDLGKTVSFDSVRVHTLDQNGSWVYLPQYVEVLVSNDGKKFKAAGRSTQFRKELLTMGWIHIPLAKQKARYIKVIAKNYGIIPEGKPGAGNPAWLFADEIQVF